MSDNLFVEELNTKLASANLDDTFTKASEILANKGLVAFPTETVYGLGGNALDPDAAAKIYAAKGRPSDNPLIVHIADTKAVWELAEEVPEKAQMLMEAFWPGPLTIILPKKDIVPDATTGGLPTVALRMPSHPAALKLIKKSGVYIAAPSANTSGRPSPTTAGHVMTDLKGRIEMVIDGGSVGIGIESTIVDMTGLTPTILRPGFITKTMLESIIGNVEIDRSITQPELDIKPLAPGMKYTHYAPKGTLTVFEPEYEFYEESIVKNPHYNGPIQARVCEAIIDQAYYSVKDGKSTVLLISDENHLYYSKLLNGDPFLQIAFQNGQLQIFRVGSHIHGETVAAKLYSVLRLCDDVNAEVIFSESFREGELGDAVMNRLLKAAGQRVIKVRNSVPNTTDLD